MDPNEYSQRLLSGFLMCPGCRQAYNTTSRAPKLLSCGHTFCDSCLIYLHQQSGSIICPEDRLPDFRDMEDIAESHHFKDIIEKIQVCCNANFNHPGEFFNPQTMATTCGECRQAFAQQEWTPIGTQDLGGYYAQSVQAMLQDQSFKERVIKENPNIKDRLKRLPLLAAREKQLLYFSILSVYWGQEMSIPMPGPPPPKYLDENGWVELNRFHNLIPEKYCQNLQDVKRWTISESRNQIEAICIKPYKRIVLRAIGLCKECGDFQGGYIEYVAVTEGNETAGSSLRNIAPKTFYTTRSKQVEKIVLSNPFPMSALREYTLKVKYAGKFLYFGNPARRVDPLKGPDGVDFKIVDPVFKGGEYQGGQGSLAGPIVKLYYEPTGPLKTT